MPPDSEPSHVPETFSEEGIASPSQDNEATSSQRPSIPPEVLEGLPDNQRGSILEFFAARTQVSGPMPNPLINKVEPHTLRTLSF